VCMATRLNVTPKTTEKSQIVCTGKSEAEVTNNKNNCAQGIVLLKLTTDGHEASSYLLKFQVDLISGTAAVEQSRPTGLVWLCS